jgi:hypothetical protein
MAISIDNFTTEEDYFANNNMGISDSRDAVFFHPKINPTPPNTQETSKSNNANLIRELFLNIGSRYNDDIEFVKFLGNHIKEMFNISQVKLSDPSIPLEIQNAIIDFLSDDANIQAVYDMYLEYKEGSANPEV